MSEVQESASKNMLVGEKKEHRLPCRGCMKTCANYATCGGRPWRVFKTGDVDDQKG
jgi:hypothetical protein